MKKLSIYFLSLFLNAFLISCREDIVKIVNLDETLPITTRLEFKTDESSGNITSESNTKTNYNIYGNRINWMNGVSGSSLFFDGLSNYYKGNINSNLIPSERVVISLWAAPKSYPLEYTSMLSTFENNGNKGFSIGINNLGNIVLQQYINGSFSSIVTDKKLPKFKWSNVIVGINSKEGNYSIYQDNTLIKTGELLKGTLSQTTGNTVVTIGRNPLDNNMGTYFSGSIDEIKIYDGIVNQQVVNYIYKSYTNPGTANYNSVFDYSNDTNRPSYHAIPDYGWANESYGLIYHDNQYHMFYQKNDVFLGIAKQNWGHFTSSNLIDWKEKNPILWPELSWEKEGIWSGGSIIQDNGTPTLYYTGVNGIKAGIGIATSTDNFETAIKEISNPVIPQAPSSVNMDFRDPYVWKENGKYHMIVGSGVSGMGGCIVYYASTDFKNWQGGNIAFKGNIGKGEGAFWEMPVMYTFSNGKKLLVVQKTPEPGNPARTFYWVGSFNNGTFIPEQSESKDFEVVNGFLSPSVTKDKNGIPVAIGIIPDEVKSEFQQKQGWANLFSLPQTWELDNSNNLIIKPHPNLNTLRGTTTVYNNLNIVPNASGYFGTYQSRKFEMEATVNVGNASKVGFVFGKSTNGQELYKVYYDTITKQWVVDGSQSSLSNLVRKDIRKGNYNINSNGTFDVRIYVDGSVLEVFVDGKSHFTGRFFPTLSDSKGVDMFVEGGNATATATIYQIKQ